MRRMRSPLLNFGYSLLLFPLADQCHIRSKVSFISVAKSVESSKCLLCFLFGDEIFCKLLDAFRRDGCDSFGTIQVSDFCICT